MPSSYSPKDDDDQAHVQLKLVYALQTAHGYEDIKEILDRLEDINALFPHDSLRSSFDPDKLRTRPLYEAAGRFTRIQHVPLSLFLSYGADVNLRNEDGQTPLHNAVSVSNKTWILDLLGAGADINAQIEPAVISKSIEWDLDKTPGSTPLHLAASCGSEWMTRLLLERGACFDIRDGKGNTPLDIAVVRRQQGPFWALVEYGAPRVPNVMQELLPPWAFTSKQIVRKPEVLVSSLESFILGNSVLGKQTTDPEYCVKCSTEKEKEVEEFNRKLENVKKWRGPWNFNTAFTKRCLLCRQIVQTLEPFSKLVEFNPEYSSPDEESGRMSPGSRLEYENSQNRYPTLEPGLTLYEECEKYRGTAWKSTITEELGSILKHIERWPDHDTGSRAAFVMAANWFHTCLTNHRKCGLSEAIPNLPTRVIDVGNGFDKPIRLIASQGTHGLYCTLSYRWYDSKPFKTTRENIDELQQGIPENELHQTIKDAITTTRTLGLRYLWVDAICIIQNDKDDWEREAATMSDVYENSMLTIAAIDEPRADQGIFRKRTYRPRPYNRDFPKDSATGYFGYSHPFYVYANNCRRRPLGELDTRGWCLQEQFLSPRILSYADGELFWDCAELTASESYPGGVPLSKGLTEQGLQARADWEAFKTMTKSIRQKGRELGLIGPVKTKPVKLWWNIVEEFTGRHLTVEMDRFVAIEGISNVVTEYANEQMVLGMWKSDLPRHLLWWVNTITGKPKLTDVLKRPKAFLCPSWSWASVIGKIAYKNVNGNAFGMYRDSFYDKRDLKTTGSPFKSNVEIMDISVSRVPNGYHGKLTLRGAMMKAYVREKDTKISYYSEAKTVRYDGHRVFLGPGTAPPLNKPAPGADQTTEVPSDQDIFEGVPSHFANWMAQSEEGDTTQADLWEQWFPDTNDDFPDEMLCFLIGIELNNQYCLCLVPTGDGEYRRIGVCSWYLGRVDVGVNGIGTLQTVTII